MATSTPASQTSPAPPAEDFSARLDSLLASYLHLLDNYTALQKAAHALQADLYLQLAKANFSTEHGRRYGQADYDERMQASRRLQRLADSAAEDEAVGGCARLQVYEYEYECDRDAGVLESTEGETKDAKTAQDREETAQRADAAHEPAAEPRPARKRRDPLHMFSPLPPLALRSAQKSSIALVQLLPELASRDAELKGLEIEIRRTRKKAAKAAKEGAAARAPEGRAAEVSVETGEHSVEEEGLPTRMKSLAV